MPIWNPFNLFQQRPPIPSEIDLLKNAIEQPSVDKTALSRYVKSIFQEKSEQLIGELMTNPQKEKKWRKIGSLLKETDPDLFHDLQASIGSIQKIAKLLRKEDISELDRFTRKLREGQIKSIGSASSLGFRDLAFPQNAAVQFHFLKLPADLAQVRSISHPVVRVHVLANLINRDKIPLDKLDLSKAEIMAIAPHLTFVDCGNLFKDSGPRGRYADWSVKEVHAFLNKCTNAEVLRINSPIITRIPPLPKCIELNCNGCFLLHTLSALPNCQFLSCTSCSLKSLPNLPHCLKLNCSGSSFLLKLPELPNCKYVNCSNCIYLSHIEGLPSCEKLDCSGCLSLSRIQDLNSCEELNYYQCLALNDNIIPERLRQSYSSVEANINKPKLSVEVEQLRQNPMQILLKLGDFLAKGSGIPKIKFIEQDGREAGGIDEGGLRRIFISRLMQALSAHCQEKEQLPFEQENLGLVPCLNPKTGNIEEQLKGFRILGTLLEHCLRSEDVTGNVFHPDLFRKLACCSFENLLDVDLDATQISDELRFKLLAADPMHSVKEVLRKFPDHITDQELQTLIEIGKQSRAFDLPGVPNLQESPLPLETKQWVHNALQHKVQESQHDPIHRIAVILQKLPEELTEEELDILIETGNQSVLFDEAGTPDLKQSPLPLESKQWVHRILKSNLLQTSKEFDTLLPAIIIAKQMQALAGSSEEWHKDSLLAALGGMQTKIEGIATTKEVLEAIEWSKSHEELDGNGYHKTKTEYVERWITEATPKELQDLLFVLTGAPALPSGKKLAFRFYNELSDKQAEFRFYHDGESQRFPTVHTCSFTVNIPINYPNYEAFKVKWEEMIAQSTNPEHSGVEEK